MHKFNDVNQTAVLTDIAAFQLSKDYDGSIGFDITLMLKNQTTLILHYGINHEKYNHDCKYLLNL